MRPISKALFLPMTAALLLTVSSCSFTNRQTAKLYQKASQFSYDLIIVPGIPLYDGKWDRVMKARVYWAKHLFDKGIAKNIMFSGNAVYSPYVESEVMALYAEAIGIPKKHIFTESKAEHSTENVYYSYKKSRKLNFKRIAVASDPFQTKMVKRFTRTKVSREVDFIPIVFDTLRRMEPDMRDPEIDESRAFVSNFTPLPERKGFWTRLKGTLGKDIDEKAYE